MDAEGRDELVNVLESRSLFGKSDEEIHIERKHVGGIYTAAFQVQIPCPEGCRLLEIETTVQVTHARERRLAALAQNRAARIDPVRIAVCHVHRRISHRFPDGMK